MKKQNDYFGLSYVISLIFSIIPVTAWVLGAVQRFKEEAYIAFVVRVLFGYVIWLIDIVWMILHKAIFRFLSVI